MSEATIFEKALQTRMVDGGRAEWSPSWSAHELLHVLALHHQRHAKLTRPRLGFFIQGELDRDVENAHKTGQKALVECLESLGPVDAGERLERVAVLGAGRGPCRLSLVCEPHDNTAGLPTHHEPRLDHPKRVGQDRARRSGRHGCDDVQQRRLCTGMRCCQRLPPSQGRDQSPSLDSPPSPDRAHTPSLSFTRSYTVK